MATATQSTAASLPHPLFGELSRHWGWLLAVGILSVILGTIGLGMTWMLTLVSVVYFGVLLIVIGVAQLLQTFKAAGWRSTFLQLLIGLLYLAAGIMVVSRPLLASLTLTWALGFALIVVGVMRIVVGVQHRGTSGWGADLVGGIITLLLGLLILAKWPSDALWVIGLFLAIELIVNGYTQILVALAARRARRPVPA
ncbi:MAG TPA: DUF308 domain-containing protein [Candidatus Limnocylindria bacterium]|nr:DUF308 domain-containing protein [Candidatus Limnocylindria bacterium]